MTSCAVSFEVIAEARGAGGLIALGSAIVTVEETAIAVPIEESGMYDAVYWHVGGAVCSAPLTPPVWVDGGYTLRTTIR